MKEDIVKGVITRIIELCEFGNINFVIMDEQTMSGINAISNTYYDGIRPGHYVTCSGTIVGPDDMIDSVFNIEEIGNIPIMNTNFVERLDHNLYDTDEFYPERKGVERFLKENCTN